MKYHLLSFTAVSLIVLSSVSPQSARSQISIYSPDVDCGVVRDGDSATGSFVIGNPNGTSAWHGVITGPFTHAFKLIGSDSITLVPLQFDTIFVLFTPSTVGISSDSLMLAGGLFKNNPVKITLRGQGLSANDTSARIAVDYNGLDWDIKVDSSALGHLIIQNTSNVSTRHLYGSITGVYAPFSFVNGDSTFNIADSAYDTIAIRFSPTTPRSFDEMMTIHSNADWPDSQKNFDLYGIAYDTLAHIQVFSASLNWDIPIDSSAPLGHFVIHNTSRVPQYLYGTITGVTEPFSFVNGDSIFNIADSAYDTVLIRFAPTMPGSFSETMTISSNADPSDSKIRLSMRGSATDTLPQIVSFARSFTWNIAMDSSTTSKLIIHNTSRYRYSAYGAITGIYAPFSFANGNGSFTIPDSAYDTIAIRYAPTTGGPFFDTLTIASNAEPPQNAMPIYLSGTVTNPRMSLKIATVDDSGRINFGSVPINYDSTAQFIIADTSTTTPNLYDTLVSPSLPFSFTGFAPPSVVVPGGSRHVQVQFNPLSPGTYTDSVIVLTNSTTPRTVIPLFGIALAAGVGEAAPPVALSLMTMPNPASDVMQIMLHSATTRTIALALYNDAGNKIGDVYSGLIMPGTRQFEYSTRGLAAGSYFLRLKSGESTAVAKVMVRH